MDVERTIEFILQQQAAAEARWAEHDARMSAFDARIAAQTAVQTEEFNSRMAKFDNNQIAIQDTQFRQLEMINGLIDTSVRHEALFKEVGERLNALISVVDGLVRRNN
jgi:hypothetical protein